MAGNDLQKTEAWAKAKQMYNLSLDANSGNLKALSNRAYMNLKVISYLLLPSPAVYLRARLPMPIILPERMPRVLKMVHTHTIVPAFLA